MDRDNIRKEVMFRNNTLPEILTLKEAVYFSRLSRVSLWRAIKNGQLTRLKGTGRRVLLHRSEMYRFLGISQPTT